MNMSNSQRLQQEATESLTKARTIYELGRKFHRLTEIGIINLAPVLTPQTKRVCLEQTIVPGADYHRMNKDITKTQDKSTPQTPHELQNQPRAMEVITPQLAIKNSLTLKGNTANEVHLEPPSSGEHSPCYTEDEDLDIKRIPEPSLVEVSEHILDSHLVQIAQSAQESQLRSGFPSLLISGVSFMYAKEKIMPSLGYFATSVYEIRNLFFRGKPSMLLIMGDVGKAEGLHKFLQSDRNIRVLLGTTFELIWIGYAFLKVTSKQKAHIPGYFAVIVRNLPPNFQKSNLMSLCNSVFQSAENNKTIAKVASSRIAHIEEPCFVTSQHCSIVVLQTREDAENLCLLMNHYQIAENYKIKVHMHPKSSRQRRQETQSHSKLFAHYFSGQKKLEEQPDLMPTVNQTLAPPTSSPPTNEHSNTNSSGMPVIKPGTPPFDKGSIRVRSSKRRPNGTSILRWSSTNAEPIHKLQTI
jgi:hypothetical protein